MFRYVVLFSFCTCFSLTSDAQRFGTNPTHLLIIPGDQHAENRKVTRSGVAEGASISVARLREPHGAQKLYERALNATAKQNYAEAQRKLDKALKIYPPFPEALTLYGITHAMAHHWGQAEQNLQSAIQTDPTYAPAYVILAGVYNAQLRFDDAEEATQHAVAAGANTWDLQYEIARSLIGKRQYESALAIADTALHQKQHGSLLHLAKAHALLGLRRYPQAATELRAYLRYQPAGDGSQHARNLLQKITPSESGF